MQYQLFSNSTFSPRKTDSLRLSKRFVVISMYVGIYVRTYVHTYVYTYVHICLSIRLSACMHVYRHVFQIRNGSRQHEVCICIGLFFERYDTIRHYRIELFLQVAHFSFDLTSLSCIRFLHFHKSALYR